MGILSWILWGLFIGAIARLVLPGRQKIGILWTIVLGVVGSLIGGFLVTEVIQVGDPDELGFASFVAAVGVSVALLALAMSGRDGSRRGRSRRRGR